MRSLLVLFALVAVAVAAPNGGQLVAHQQPFPVAYAVPGAVSHQSRVDYKTSPVVATEQVFANGPFVTTGLAGGPAFYSANPYFGTPLAYNYYNGQPVLSSFVAPRTVFAAYK